MNKIKLKKEVFNRENSAASQGKKACWRLQLKFPVYCKIDEELMRIYIYEREFRRRKNSFFAKNIKMCVL